ncbi:unnamed protein product [Adineta ricciae]|uniref:Retrotransposon gag domain-containing protein n=1 Tax=Adineta ricciae TaxID=249248 RepID=A0A815SEC6_ADIRI|nr:unnamed protein product [Adineta ricciae]
MPPEKSQTEKIPLDEAVQRIQNMCINNAERISNLEEKYTQMYKSIVQKQEEIEARMNDIQTQSTEMHIKVRSTLDETKQQFDTTKQQYTEIIQTLHSITNGEESQSQDIQESAKQSTNYLVSTQPVLKDIDGDSQKFSKKAGLPLEINDAKTSKPLTIITPSTSAVPTFAGKCSESPNKFLIRVQEYAETVYRWDQSTLLLGVSQFLRGTALDWYCQLIACHRRPQTWTQFVSLFTSQFCSPLQIARKEQEWYECKQCKDETINEFLIRLRAVWLEQRPKETEVDFIKHFLCKMRSDLFAMMGVSISASLDHIILEAQKVEEILFRRDREQRLADCFKQPLYRSNVTGNHEYYTMMTPQSVLNQIIFLFSFIFYLEHSFDEENVLHQPNNGNSLQNTNTDFFSVHFWRSFVAKYEWYRVL